MQREGELKNGIGIQNMCVICNFDTGQFVISSNECSDARFRCEKWSLS